jgi:hypothetical protein
LESKNARGKPASKGDVDGYNRWIIAGAAVAAGVLMMFSGTPGAPQNAAPAAQAPGPAQRAPEPVSAESALRPRLNRDRF